MSKRIYCNPASVPEILAQITHQQTSNNLFVNVSVKPYKGKKHNQTEMVTIKIG